VVDVRGYIIVIRMPLNPQNHRTYASDLTGSHRYMIDAERGKATDARATDQQGPVGDRRSLNTYKGFQDFVPGICQT